ncbi:MAG: GGDEF domain-containing protein [Acidimicrobiaceae bacterium]|uniref:GGDEF domain-containing protein n=1 Tax=Candidatus Poriferisodalis multihospitum TaxID=2983191 RepID=UPI00238DED4E|nr:GGDEF domain-containing protein [Candidatus Poriferisodalis multihospitum]MDE0318995.1 GGDEF domain-containing protein [Acidimicrobiaceae bacterium]MDE0497701.1 GGDEF domain-containing protein [Acidimicrobiaceae bacterium]
MSRSVASGLRVGAAALAAALGGGWWLASGRWRRAWRADSLTGAATRDGALRHLHTELARSTRTGRMVGVAFCDIDAFKQVNDQHGHLAGDLVLVTVAQCLRDAVRPSDVVARVGGDEFVVVCGGLRGAADMEIVTERLQASLTQAPAQRETGDPLAEMGVTVSIGSATGRGGEATAGALLHAADRSMYRQKGWRP